MTPPKISAYIYPGIIALNKGITFDLIREAVCIEFDIPFNEIASSSQKRVYVEPRQILQTLARSLTPESQAKIGMRFEGKTGKYKDHATIIHSRNIFYEHYETESDYRTTVRRILLRIGVNGDYFDRKTKTSSHKRRELTNVF